MNNITASPNFKATTNIKSCENYLSKQEIKELTKIGERIGFKTDTINFNISKLDNDTLIISHKAKFNIDGNLLESNHKKHTVANNFKPYSYVKEKMFMLKELYNDVASRMI